jgi:hypothetical protein
VRAGAAAPASGAWAHPVADTEMTSPAIPAAYRNDKTPLPSDSTDL